MTWYNPKTWLQKKGEGVYFAVTLDAPIAGVSRTQPRKPWIFVENMALEDATKQTLRINWHTVRLHIRQELELGNQCLTLNLTDAKDLLEGI
jgi:hypothetical protein